MKDTKAVELLCTLDKNELKELGKFIASPYFSRGRDVLPLFNELKKFHPDFDDPALTRENIYNRLFPKKKFGDAGSSNLMKTLTSELFISAKNFLAQKEFDNDRKRRSLYTLKQLRERKLYKEFEKEYSLTEKDVEDVSETGVDNFLEFYFNSNEYSAYSIEIGNVQNVFDSLLRGNEFSMIHALMKSYMNPDLRTTTKAFNISYKENLNDILLENLDSEKMMDEMRKTGNKYLPYVEVFNMVYMMSKYPEREEYYFTLKSLLDKHIALFIHSQKYILYAMLGSYCAMKSLSENNERFLREGFDINARTVELGIYKYSSKEDFQINSFRNIVLAALDVNELDWLEDFIEKYYAELNTEHRDNMRLFSLAHLYSVKKDYEKALEHLSQVKFNFFLFKMDARYLQFRIYYEMNYDEQGFSTLSAITQYLTSTKDLSPTFTKRGKMFVKFARELLKRKSERNFEDLPLFKRQVTEAKDVNSRSWILEKIGEMGK